MSKVFLLDTNISSAPIYKFLVDQGLDVSVVGGNPDDTLAKCIKKYIKIDYTNIDMMYSLIADHGVEYLVPGCNDRSYIAAAQLNEKYNFRFPGLDSLTVSYKINSKEKFRKYAIDNKIPVPELISVSDIERSLPVIVKPVDSYSGRGVTMIDARNLSAFPQATIRARNSSLTDQCLVEKYVVGQLYSYTAFIRNGRIIVGFIVEEHSTANPFVVDTSRVVDGFDRTIINGLRNNIELMSHDLKLTDGLIHTQFIYSEKKYWIIEITRRCPGDLYSQLIELSTGFNYIENYVLPFLGRSPSVNRRLERKPVIRHTISQSMDGYLGSLDFFFPVSIAKWYSLTRSGDELQKSPHGRAAIVFLESDSIDTHEKLFDLLLTRKAYSNASMF